MEFDLKLLTPLFIGLLGVGAGFGVAKLKLKTVIETVAKLQKSWNTFHGIGEVPGALPMYVRRQECSEEHKEITASFNTIKTRMHSQESSIQKLENFARWQLTTKEGLTLLEANDVLENGK